MHSYTLRHTVYDGAHRPTQLDRAELCGARAALGINDCGPTALFAPIDTCPRLAVCVPVPSQGVTVTDPIMPSSSSWKRQ